MKGRILSCFWIFAGQWLTGHHASVLLWGVREVPLTAFRWAHLSLFCLMECHYSNLHMWYFCELMQCPLWEPVQWSASAHIPVKWSPLSPILCAFIWHFLSLTHRVSDCVNNESIFWGILWLQMGWRSDLDAWLLLFVCEPLCSK